MTDLTEARELNQKATVACVLGVVAMASVLLLALVAALDPGGLGWGWLLLPVLALGCGVPAIFVGAAAWVDARQSKSGNGLRHAQVGAILGGIATGAMVLAGAVLFVIFIFFMLSYPEG